MTSALKYLLLGRAKGPKNITIRALQKRYLVGEGGELTDHGRVLALSLISLTQQCKLLDIPLENWNASWGTEPEEYVKTVFLKRGNKAFFVENTFGLFIDYLMGDAILEVAKRLEKNVYTLNPPYDPELFFWVKRDLDKYLSNFNLIHCQNNLSVCRPFLQSILMEETLLQIANVFNEMYRALGVEKVKSLIRMYFSNPLAYNYRGWPDLFVIENDFAYCVEVKTSDRLNINQLVTIPDLVGMTNIPVRIVRLITGNKYSKVMTKHQTAIE